MTLMTLAYAVCKVPCAPVRKDPSHRSEMISQILFGEKVIIKEIDEERGWVRIMCEWDQYEGWAKEGQVQIIDKKDYKKEIKYITDRSNDHLILDKESCLLPIASSLFLLKGKGFPWYDDITYSGRKVKLSEQRIDRTSIIEQARKYLGASYLWGGRSNLGIDCSGLSQMVFRFFNIALYRDASQQISQGVDVDFLSYARSGDLAFFDNDEGDITHVGILIGNDKIIHATDSSGCVVIDTIDNGGIISHLLRKRTHKLRMIKNILGDI